MFQMPEALLNYINTVTFSFSDGVGSIAEQLIQQGCTISEAIQFLVYVHQDLTCHYIYFAYRHKYHAS